MDRANRPGGGVADIQHGWEIYSADEQRMGKVDDLQAGYIVAHQGMFFAKDLFIPLSAVRRIEHERVYLTISKDEVDGEDWDRAPADTAMAAGAGRMTDRATDAAVGKKRVGSEQEMAAPARSAEGSQTLHLHEEELRTSTERVQAGEVRLGKEVVEEQKTVNVPVTHEEVFIERRAGNRRPDDHTIDTGAGQTIRVPLSAEQVSVEKVAVVTEEVSVGKRQVHEDRQVTETVKHEEARVEREGDVRVQGDDAPPPGGPARR